MKYINKRNINFDRNNFYVVIDFDKTITSRDSMDSWGVVANKDVVGQAFSDEINKLADFYYPIEIDYKIEYDKKEKAIIEWYNKCMDVFYKYNLTREQLDKSIEISPIIFRKGAKDFLEKMYFLDVPVIIMSAGIGNVIQGFLEKNNCYYNNIHIISNFIKFEDNQMQKFSDKMIHSLNKTIENKINDDIIKDKKSAILAGDLIDDIKMLPKSKLENAVSVGFLNDKIEENLQFFNDTFDIVLTNEDATFDNIQNLLF